MSRSLSPLRSARNNARTPPLRKHEEWRRKTKGRALNKQLPATNKQQPTSSDRPAHAAADPHTSQPFPNLAHGAKTGHHSRPGWRSTKLATKAPIRQLHVLRTAPPCGSNPSTNCCKENGPRLTTRPPSPRRARAGLPQLQWLSMDRLAHRCQASRWIGWRIVVKPWPCTHCSESMTHRAKSQANSNYRPGRAPSVLAMHSHYGNTPVAHTHLQRQTKSAKPIPLGGVL